MTSAVRTRPLLPASYYKPSTLGTASFLLYALCLFAVPAVLLYMVANSTYGIAVKIALMVPLTIVGAFGLNLMGFVGHEGMHLSLTRTKYASAITGLFY